MKPFLITPIAAVFACCLALTSPLRTAARVTHGTASCAEGKIVQIGDGVGCKIPLHVRQPGHGGGSGPNDWGMCGVLSMSASFGPPTIARIIVEPDGYYSAELVGHEKSVIPTLNYSCVLFTDFTGVPPAAEASAFDPTSPKGTASIYNKPIPGSAKNACIWAGLSGNLTTIVSSDMAIEGLADAQYEGPATNIGEQYATSYAFCSGYTTASWKGWKYFRAGYTFYSPTHALPLPFDDAHDWCYTDGFSVNYQYTQESLSPVSGGLTISSGGNYGLEKQTPTPPSSQVDFNCLPLDQK